MPIREHLMVRDDTDFQLSFSSPEGIGAKNSFTSPFNLLYVTSTGGRRLQGKGHSDGATSRNMCHLS